MRCQPAAHNLYSTNGTTSRKATGTIFDNQRLLGCKIGLVGDVVL